MLRCRVIHFGHPSKGDAMNHSNMLLTVASALALLAGCPPTTTNQPDAWHADAGSTDVTSGLDHRPADRNGTDLVGTDRTSPPLDASSTDHVVVTQPTNMLNNGGFEYGLQCYSNWIWSQTGIDYRGDYDFVLSTDAHGGTYALEIRCIGSDCGSGAKAAIYTQQIASAPSQAYRLTFFTKCPTGMDAIVYLPGMAGGDVYQNVACSDQWASNQVELTTAADATGFYFYFYNRGIQSLLVDDVVLTLGDGSVPEQRLYHGGQRDVQIVRQRVQVDGVPRLALGFFNVPYADLQQVADLGGNTITSLGLEQSADCFNTAQQSFLDHAYELGIAVLPDSTFSARLDEPAVYPAIVQRFAPHLANIGWFLVDEPDQQDVAWYYIDAATLISEHNSARTATSLPMLADFQRASWEQTSVVAPYAGSVEIWMAEPYGDDFGGVTHAVDLFDSIVQKPIWLAQDAITASLIVAKAYFVVVSGATGIVYFTWADFKGDSARLAAAEQAFGELNQLRDVIFDQSIDADVGAPSEVALIARQHDGTQYILAVNPTTSSVSGDFTLAGLTSGQTITVMFENRTISAQAGRFSDSFAAQSRHVYRID